MPVMNEESERMHLGARLQYAGMTTHFCAQTGSVVKFCADTSPARTATAATLTLWNFMLAARGAGPFFAA